MSQAPETKNRHMAKLDQMLVELQKAAGPPENRTQFQRDYPLEAELLLTLLKNERSLVAEINQNRKILKELASKTSSSSLQKDLANLSNATILVKKNVFGDDEGKAGLWRQNLIADFLENDNQ
mgnify:CR=1 FL=1